MKKSDCPRDTPFWSFVTLTAIGCVVTVAVVGLKKIVSAADGWRR
jgi:hypothetical protein